MTEVERRVGVKRIGLVAGGKSCLSVRREQERVCQSVARRDRGQSSEHGQSVDARQGAVRYRSCSGESSGVRVIWT